MAVMGESLHVSIQIGIENGVGICGAGHIGGTGELRGDVGDTFVLCITMVWCHACPCSFNSMWDHCLFGSYNPQLWIKLVI